MLTASFQRTCESPEYESASTCRNLRRNYDTENMKSYVRNDKHDVTRLFIACNKTALFLEDSNDEIV